jgi:hypothetical protein
MPEIRAYRAGDEDGIRRLFETCHRRPLDPDVWRWRYASRPEGNPATAVAIDAGKVVGHVSALPVRLERGASAVRAGLWVDLMVHPNHRNLTMFLDMAEENRRLCAAAGIELLYAFPNNNSFPVLKRMLDWKDAGDILALEGALASLRRPEAAGVETRTVEAFGPEFDDLWARIRPNDRLCGARGAERLGWRYRRRPAARYPAWAARDGTGRLGGFVVVKTFDGPSGRIGDVLDLWAVPGPAAGGLLKAAFDFFEREKVATVSAWALEGTAQYAVLNTCGLKPGADRTHLAGRWTAQAGPEFPARHADWSLFKGDSDVF